MGHRLGFPRTNAPAGYEQTHCGQPESDTTSGLVAYLDGEPVGWCAVEPRSAYIRLGQTPWAGRAEDKTDDSVWAAGYSPPAIGSRSAPGRVSAFPGKDENDLVLWIESRRAVAVGDTLIDRSRGLQIPVDWLSEGVTREQVAALLRPLLELPVELVLTAHGAQGLRRTEPPSSARSPDAA